MSSSASLPKPSASASSSSVSWAPARPRGETTRSAKRPRAEKPRTRPSFARWSTCGSARKGTGTRRISGSVARPALYARLRIAQALAFDW